LSAISPLARLYVKADADRGVKAMSAEAARQPPEKTPLKPLDVLFVISALGIGGSERQLALLAGRLTRLGMKVAVYSFLDGPVRGQLESDGVEVMCAPRELQSAGGIATAATDLYRVMRRRRPRIAHFFLPAAYLVGAPLALLARVPLRVMSRRSLNVYQRGWPVRAIECAYHRTMHAVLGNSRGVVRELLQENVPRERLGLIYNGIDAPGAFHRDEVRANLGLLPGALVMTIVANLIPYKGHGDLLDALSIAAPRLPQGWRLLVVGRDEGIGDNLRARAQRASLEDNIAFLGTRDDVPSLLAASDVGILCSHEEGFANAVLEGMAAGLPMIVTRVGGNTEATRDGETGLVVEPRDPESLATAILRLAGDPALRAHMGAAGCQRVHEEFGVDHFVRSHAALYAALQAGKRPADVPEIAVD
jgi:glycosyltransferase involved in cell wall biosynthesis